MKAIFIDANIWLSLYHFTKDDLNEFKKLKEINYKEIKIYIPLQVRDEVFRNREAKLKEALETFTIGNFRFPVFVKEYEEYDDIYNDYKELNKRINTLKKKIEGEIVERELPADIVLTEFFNDEMIIPLREELVLQAERRYRRGNPPGKKNSYGDAINWECLLKEVPDGEDLYIVSADKDFQSIIYKTQINEFLAEEWKQKKSSNIHYYDTLESFLSEHANEIKINHEGQKIELIEKLRRSTSFITTHGIIKVIMGIEDWTPEQVEDLCYIARTNSQVSWILDDEDVSKCYEMLCSSVSEEEAGETTKRLKAYYDHKNANNMFQF